VVWDVEGGCMLWERSKGRGNFFLHATRNNDGEDDYYAVKTRARRSIARRAKALRFSLWLGATQHARDRNGKRDESSLI
jgi:hypothetical protein